jgi:hypothetical protein
MLFTLENLENQEIALEVLLLARFDPRMDGRWPKSEPIVMVDPLPGAHGLDMNWRLVIPYGYDGELTAALQNAAATVQAKWRLKLPFLGSSAIAG